MNTKGKKWWGENVFSLLINQVWKRQFFQRQRGILFPWGERGERSGQIKVHCWGVC